jgi:hypothetical protein
MAQTILTLDYTSNDWSSNFYHQFAIGLNGTTYNTDFYYAVVNTPTQVFHVQKGLSTTATVTNIKARIDSVITALGLTPSVTTEQLGTTLKIYVGTEADNTFGCFYAPTTSNTEQVLFNCFTGTSFDQANISVTYGASTAPDTPAGVTPVTGLSADGYLINNDIYLESPSYISPLGFDLTTYYAITFKNLTTQAVTRPIEVYPLPGLGIKLNLAPVIKSLFSYPETNNDYTTLVPFEINTNYLAFEINIKRYHTTDTSNVEVYEETTISKSYIRGGRRTNESNITLPVGSILRPTTALPIWAGYPVAEYKLKAGYKIEKINNLNDVALKERLSVKGCNPTYIKFLNQYGAYSYWLFEGLTDKPDGTSLGYANNLGEVTDLGKEYEQSSTVYSKVPAKWLPIILDLIISPEVLLYTGSNTWQRIVLDSNKIEENSYKKVYETKLNYKKVTNFNPSLLW